MAEEARPDALCVCVCVCVFFWGVRGSKVVDRSSLLPCGFPANPHQVVCCSGQLELAGKHSIQHREKWSACFILTCAHTKGPGKASATRRASQCTQYNIIGMSVCMYVG